MFNFRLRRITRDVYYPEVHSERDDIFDKFVRNHYAFLMVKLDDDKLFEVDNVYINPDVLHMNLVEHFKTFGDVKGIFITTVPFNVNIISVDNGENRPIFVGLCDETKSIPRPLRKMMIDVIEKSRRFLRTNVVFIHFKKIVIERGVVSILSMRHYRYLV